MKDGLFTQIPLLRGSDSIRDACLIFSVKVMHDCRQQNKIKFIFKLICAQMNHKHTGHFFLV